MKKELNEVFEEVENQIYAKKHEIKYMKKQKRKHKNANIWEKQYIKYEKKNKMNYINKLDKIYEKSIKSNIWKNQKSKYTKNV